MALYSVALFINPKQIKNTIFHKAFAFLLILNPKITIVLILFFGLIGLVFYKLIHEKIANWGAKSKKHRGLKLKNLKESFGGIRDIKILGKELNFLKFFSNNNYLENEYTKKNEFFSNMILK